MSCQWHHCIVQNFWSNGTSADYNNCYSVRFILSHGVVYFNRFKRADSDSLVIRSLFPWLWTELFLLTQISIHVAIDNSEVKCQQNLSNYRQKNRIKICIIKIWSKTSFFFNSSKRDAIISNLCPLIIFKPFFQMTYHLFLLSIAVQFILWCKLF